MKRAIGLATVLTICGVAAFGQPRFRNAGASLVTEHNTNKVIETGERVTVSLALKNVGDEAVSNLVATIQSDNGVSNATPTTQNYGVLLPCAPSVARDFTFTATAPTNALLLVNLDLEDSGRNLGPVSFRFRMGPQVTVAANTNKIDIYEVGMASAYPSVLSLSNVPGSIIDVSLTLSNLSHTYPDDLDILLVSPSGDSVLLMSDACGGDALDRVTLTFSDHADFTLPDLGPPESRIVRPMNYGSGDFFPDPAPLGPYASVMSAFNGKLANGDWQLFIVDDSSGDDGALYDGWALTITTLQPVDAIPTVILLPRSTNNVIRFTVSGRPGNTYAIETSPDPVQSFPLESFIMPASGARTFEYPLEPSNRFFRASTDP